MNYGLYIPNFGKEINARALANLAQEAEEAGWDGFFIWDQILHRKSNPSPLIDPWVTLAAIAMETKRIRIGTTVTALARRRPWKLARETVTLDHLSNGRLTLGVGLGSPPDADFSQFGEDPDPKVRGVKLDEGLEILTGLWSGKPYAFKGKYYNMEKTVFLPRPVQRPRIPIWVGGYWPIKAPLRRAALWDGAFPLKSGSTIQPKDLKEILKYIKDLRGDNTFFDLVMMGITPGDKPAEAWKKVEKYTKAGLTWWLENLFLLKNSVEEMRKRIRQGPPGPE